MATAKLFMTGRSQAVRLPKAFRFEGTEVEILRQDDDVILRARPTNGTAVFDTLSTLPADFMTEGRQDSAPQTRETL